MHVVIESIVHSHGFYQFLEESLSISFPQTYIAFTDNKPTSPIHSDLQLAGSFQIRKPKDMEGYPKILPPTPSIHKRPLPHR